MRRPARTNAGLAQGVVHVPRGLATPLRRSPRPGVLQPRVDRLEQLVLLDLGIGRDRSRAELFEARRDVGHESGQLSRMGSELGAVLGIQVSDVVAERFDERLIGDAASFA